MPGVLQFMGSQSRTRLSGCTSVYTLPKICVPVALPLSFCFTSSISHRQPSSTLLPPLAQVCWPKNGHFRWPSLLLWLRAFPAGGKQLRRGSQQVKNPAPVPSEPQ